ncbi:MAG: hypothetical protein ACYTEL_07200 [Planctomycetota bacterium]|jgi:hypothetical protein
MFRLVSIIGFAVTVVALGLHRVICRPGGRSAVGGESPLAARLFRRLASVFAVLSFFALVVTGFYPALVLGKSLSGYWVMIHTTAGGVFAGCLAVVALLCAEYNRLANNDGPGVGQKTAFWLILVLALPVILSIVLCMLPLLGTEGQKFLLNIHRYSALLLTLAAIVHGYLTVRTRAKR